MAFAHFIARRILRDKDRQAQNASDRLSRPIVAIAVLGIVIGMAVMILTVGISTGFQREVRAKVSGAGAHIEIVPLAQTDPKESSRVRIQQPFYPWLDTVPGVAHIQVFAVKPGIVETPDEIQGVVVKGVGRDHDWSFLRQHLVAGDVLDIGDGRPAGEAGVQAETLISQWLARRLRQQVGDTVTIYLVKGREDIRPRKYRIRGIYETGLEKIDHQLVFVDIAHLQRFAQWGLQAEIGVSDSAGTGGLRIEGMAFGGDRTYTFEWPGTALRGRGPHTIRVNGDTTLMLVAHDNSGTLPDTARLHIHLDARADQPFQPAGLMRYTRTGSGGSYKDYCGGFEVALKDHRDLNAIDDRIYGDLGEGLRTITVQARFPEIFAWLELLDTNVVVVIVLMVIVAIINMTSALLIIILERTNMIGVLKALGGSNGMIRRIFLIDAAYILGFGIVLGDVLGIGLALLQRSTGLVRLPIESYYVDQVPVALDPGTIIALNLGVLVVCVAALVLPSLLVTRIAPAKAIRFE